MVKFDIFNLSNDAITTDVAGRWIETGGWSAILSGRWHATQNWPNTLRPTLLRGLRVDRFQATFALYRTNSAPSAELKFIFNAADQDSYDYVRLYHGGSGQAPYGYSRPEGKASIYLSGTRTNANVPAVGNTDPLWVRITNDGTTVSVRCATSEAGLATASDCYSSTAFNARGGMIGLASSAYYPEVDDLKIYADRDHNGSYETLEHEEHFTLDGDNTTTESLTHDPAGNLTYDGIYQYGYDAWNRMIQVTKAYRDSGGTLHSGSVITLSRYDGLNRRIEKKVQSSADLDCTYGYYYDRQSLIEARNGSSQTIQQYVWGLDYIDELIQVANNSDPTEDNTCETSYWACIDANFNVSRLIGVIGLDENSQPVYGTVERYEYTPYGQRTVFFSAGSNDPDAYAPTLISRRISDGTITQPYGVCPIGHQGLVQDEESGLAYGRERMWNLLLRRGNQRDYGGGYVDGMNLYQYVQSNPIRATDPTGRYAFVPGRGTFRGSLAWNSNIDSAMIIYFKPAQIVIDNCLCKKIQFKQWIQETYQGSWGVWHSTNGYDDDPSGGGFYHESATDHDWSITDPKREAVMGDTPGAKYPGQVKYIHQEFSTQAVCTEGVEKDKEYGTLYWAHQLNFVTNWAERYIRGGNAPNPATGKTTDKTVQVILQKYIPTN